jgi:flagellar motor protein MotB
VNFWPALIDMLTSILMFFLLVSFVEHNFSAASAELAFARQKQAGFQFVFHNEFHDEIASGQVADSADLNQLQIRFGDGVLFEPGRYELSPQGERLLERLARVFHGVDASGTRLYDQIQIEGHTDDMEMQHGTYPHDNWELSTARAMSVLKYLTRRAHPPLRERRMSVNGYAQNRPIAQRRSRNRRIEIRIFFSGRPPAARP